MASGRWIRRFGYRGALQLALGVSIAGSLRTLFSSVIAMVAGITIFCCGIFVAQAAANNYIGIAAQHGRAAAVGLYVTAYYIGGSFGAAIPGWFWNRAGWAGCVVFIILVQIATALVVRHYWKLQEQPSEAVFAAVD